MGFMRVWGSRFGGLGAWGLRFKGWGWFRGWVLGFRRGAATLGELRGVCLERLCFCDMGGCQN